MSKGTEFEPLKAYDVEKKVARLKKDLHEVSDFEESKISQVNLTVLFFVLLHYFWLCNIMFQNWYKNERSLLRLNLLRNSYCITVDCILLLIYAHAR